ncbi:CHAT domain-containing protein [Actinophytocola sp.]|uniref:CHAT domain-containing protein n=1 Tax=Actinophytocola sp. TaxID=1872138 RepID=UPI002ED84161
MTAIERRPGREMSGDAPQVAGRALIDLALVDPELALRRAGAVLGRRRVDAALRVAAWHAVASARVELGEFTVARRVAARAVGVGGAQRPELRLLLAWIEHNRGRLDASERHLAALPAGLADTLAARARCVRGLNLCVRGDYARAVPELTAAIAASRRHGDSRWEANGLVGRGVVRSLQLRLAAAEADLAAAQRVCAARGESERAASCLHNRGFVAAQAGDIPRALALFAEAERAGLRARERGEALLDRATTLLAGGLVADAGEALARASALLDGAGRGLRLAEACLALGECAFRAGSIPMARDAAGRASVSFRRQRRAGWVAAARALELRIRLAERAEVSMTEVRRVAERAARHGFRLEAAWLRLAAAEPRLWLDVERERARGPAALRAAGWLARARLAAAEGRSVFPACRAGLGVVDRYAAGMGALELQAGVAGLATALARTGLGAALRSGRPRTVLAWVERCRAAAFRVAPVRPPEDPALRAALVELRDAQGGAPHRVAALEETVRRLSLAAPGRVPEPADPPLGRFGDRALLSYWVHDGELGVVTVVDRGVRLHRLGPAGPLADHVDALRLAAGVGSPAESLAAARLDRVLLAPVRAVVGDRPLVVVPAGELRGLPWAALPTCAGRPVSVVPTAAVWRPRTPGTGRRVWVAGPRLAHATTEVATLHGRWGGQRRSTVDGTLDAMEGAEIAHLAAHCRFREDSPMFTAVELADGPLYAYDLDRLTEPPRLLVLSACEGARGALVGLAAVLLRRGTALVASTTPVPDAAAEPLFAAMYTRLADGLSTAEALATAQRDHGHLGFVCLG